MKDHWIEASTRNPYVRLLALVVGLFFLGWAIYGLRGVLTPVFVSFLIAYLLDPVVDRFEERGVNRTVAIVILMFALFILVGVMVFLIGLAVSELADVIKNLPAWMEATVNEWRDTWRDNPVVVWLYETVGLDLRNINAEYLLESIRQLREQLLSFVPRLAGPVRTILTHALSGTVALVAWAANIILVPLFSFYLLRDFDRIVARIKELIPIPYQDEVSRVFRDIDETIAAFIRGQLLVMLILGVLYGIGLAAFQVKMGFGIGLIAGLLCVIPYLGFFIGIVLALLMSLMGGDLMWLNLLGTIVTFGVVQILEGTIITPKVVGDKVGLHPVWVIVALMVGAHVLGVLGMLLAVPVAAVIRIILKRALKRYKTSRLFLQGAERISIGRRSSEKPDSDQEVDRPSAGSQTSKPEKTAASPAPEPARGEPSAAPSAPRPKPAGKKDRDRAAAKIFAPDPEPQAELQSGSDSIRRSVDAAAKAETGEHEVIGAQRASNNADPSQSDEKSSTKTLPDHPIHPHLKKMIDDQKRASTPGTPDLDDDSGKTLTGVPVQTQKPAKDSDSDENP